MREGLKTRADWPGFFHDFRTNPLIYVFKLSPSERKSALSTFSDTIFNADYEFRIKNTFWWRQMAGNDVRCKHFTPGWRWNVFCAPASTHVHSACSSVMNKWHEVTILLRTGGQGHPNPSLTPSPIKVPLGKNQNSKFRTLVPFSIFMLYANFVWSENSINHASSLYFRCTHAYKRPCPSVHLSIHPSVCVCPSFCL